ncbi:MAG TPA: DUF4387 domain-containing protein [Firmicutes bacterium]|nr:DUF4387 domain-containing protein [Bacillota bacterium]
MIIRLRDVAAVIRSKNSGPYELTLDVIFKEEDMFDKVVKGKIINPDLIADLYKLDPAHVLSIIEFAPALAIKVTMVRPIGSGGIGERDVYGAQQHAPLMDLVFEDKNDRRMEAVK